MWRFVKYAFGAFVVAFICGFIGDAARDIGFPTSTTNWFEGYAVGIYNMFVAFKLGWLKV